MSVVEMIQIADLGSTLCFALLVWGEVRGMRQESLALLQELNGYIKGSHEEKKG